ncbi:hypothetical protein [Micromonospora sp. LOL_024]|uniref:hypothetical protein n=1 Tax=Micromonospora sp. LOL_024 TaxID=3345412 RepID=UPI003A8AB39E
MKFGPPQAHLILVAPQASVPERREGIVAAFTVTYADHDGEGPTRLRLAGELDMGSAAQLNAVIDRLAGGGWPRVAGATSRVERVLQLTGLAEVLGCGSGGVDPAGTDRP